MSHIAKIPFNFKIKHQTTAHEKTKMVSIRHLHVKIHLSHLNLNNQHNLKLNNLTHLIHHNIIIQ
jgi:hypothetical protein